MIIKIPKSIDNYFRSDITKKLKWLNPQFSRPSKASWQTEKPTLAEPVSREVIEVELKSLEAAWHRCSCYLKNGATKIHLVLHPRLFATYMNGEAMCVEEQPIPIIEIYMLPKVERKTRNRKESKAHKRTETLIKEVDEKTYVSYDKLKSGEYPKVQVIEEVKPLKNQFTCSACKELIKEENCSYPVCQKYNWEIASDLTERDAVCEE